MRYPAVLALFALIGVGAGAQEIPPQRDGTWLQHGMSQYRRFNEHESLSDEEANSARVVSTYVCAVVDLEKYLVFRADLLKAAVADARKQHRMNPQELQGMGESLPLLVPLLDTRFFQDNPTCDKALQIVWDYLDKYPEVLAKDADVIVEKALLDAYGGNGEP